MRRRPPPPPSRPKSALRLAVASALSASALGASALGASALSASALSASVLALPALITLGCDGDEPPAPARFDLLINASAPRANAPALLSFTSQSNGPLDGDYAYLWTFAEGGSEGEGAGEGSGEGAGEGAGAAQGAPTSEEATPSYLFERAGTYTVSLTLTDRASGASGEARVSVEILPEVSLAVSDLSVLSSGPVVASASVDIAWSARHEGGEAVRPWQTVVFLVPAAEGGGAPALSPELPAPVEGAVGARWSAGAGVTVVGQLPVPAGSQPGSASKTLTVSLPADLASGDYFLGVYADDEGAAGDPARADNLALSPVALRVRNPMETGPDLQVCGVEVPSFALVEPGQRPAIPQGEQLSVQLCFSNTGDRPVIDTPYALFLSEDAVFDEGDLLVDRGAEAAIGPGDRLTRDLLVDLPADLTPGVYRFLAVVDPADGVLERREDNNERASGLPFEVVEPGQVSGVDLVATGLSVSEAITAEGRVYWGQVLTGSLTVQNRGDAPVGRLFVVRFNALPVAGGSPVQLPSINLAPLAGGESREVPFELSISRRVAEGVYRLQAELDPTNATNDVNPTNNRRNLADELTLGGEPSFDPAARALALSASSAAAGGSFAATLTVANLGDDPTGAVELLVQISEDARADASDRELLTLSLESLAGGEEREVPLRLDLPLDLDQQVTAWRLVATLDPRSRLSGELSAANNQVISEPLSVTGAMGGCAEDGYEDNDAAGQSALLAEGVYEALGACDAEDWFGTQVPENTTLEVRLSFTPSEGTPTLSLADAGGQVALAGELRGDALALFDAPRPAARRALYRVTGGGARLGYGLEVSLTPRPANAEVRLSALAARPSIVESESPVELSLLLSNIGAQGAAAGRVLVSLAEGPSPSAPEVAPLGALDAPSVGASSSVELTGRLTLPANLSDGLYYLVARLEGAPEGAGEGGWWWAAAPVRVDAARACTADAYEPNGSPYEQGGLTTRAADLEAGSYTDLYTCDGDDDWYRVRLEAGDALSAQISFATREGDLDLALYEANGATLVSRSEGLQGTERVELFRAPAAADYLLRVYLNPSDAVNVATRYALSLEVGPSGSCGDDGFEPNGSAAEAAPVPDGSHDLVVCPGGEDWFRVSVPAGNAVSFQVDAGIGDVELSLFDPDDLLIESSQRRIAHEAALTGTYRLRVRPTAQDAPAPYTLTVSGVSGVDLAASGLTLTSDVAGPGDELLARLTVSNLRGDAASAVLVRFSLSADARPTSDDLVLAEQTLPRVEGAGLVELRQRLTVPAAALEGAQQLLVEIDPLRRLPDIRPGNNILRAPFTVLGACLDDDDRANEGPASATPLEWSAGSAEGVICAYTEDWLSLTAPAGARRLTLSVAGGGAGATDLDLAVYRADTGALLAASTTEVSPEVVLFTLPASAELLVQVDGFLDARASYTLSWQ